MVLLLTFLGILKYFLIGTACLLVFQKNAFVRQNISLPLFLVFAFLLGISVTSITLHIGVFVGDLTYSYVVIWLLAFVSLVYSVVNSKKYISPIVRGDWKIGTLFITGFLWQSILLAFQPVVANDARGIWLLKTKALVDGVPAFLTQLQAPLYSYSHSDYPITMPLLYADLMKPMGGFWEPAIGILSFTFFFMLIVGIYSAIRYYTKATTLTAFLICCVVFFSPEYLKQGWAGLSDVPLSLAILGSMFSLLLIKEYDTITSYLFPISFALLAATIKNEGQTFLLLVLITIAVVYLKRLFSQSKFSFKQLPWKQLTFAALFIAFFGLSLIIWKFVTTKLGISNDVVGSPNLREIISRIPTLFIEIIPRLLDGYRFGILFIPALLLLALPSAKKDSVSWSIIIIGQAAVYIVIYLITPHDLAWHISTSLSRLILHLLPSVFLLMLSHRSTKSIV